MDSTEILVILYVCATASCFIRLWQSFEPSDNLPWYAMTLILLIAFIPVTNLFIWMWMCWFDRQKAVNKDWQ